MREEAWSRNFVRKSNGTPVIYIVDNVKSISVTKVYSTTLGLKLRAIGGRRNHRKVNLYWYGKSSGFCISAEQIIFALDSNLALGVICL